MVVPGYFQPKAVNMVSPVSDSEAISASPEFNETLIDWISRQLATASIPLVENNH